MAVGMKVREEVEGGAQRSTTHEELCTRTSWVDARTALTHIRKGRATGSRGALWVRKKLQDQLFQLGEFSETHAGKILFVALLIMATFCVGLKSATLTTDIEKLWVEEGGRLERELKYVEQTLGVGTGTTNQILIQTPKEGGSDSVLTTSALTAHLNVLLAATRVTVDLFDITWRLNDICFATSFPYFENHLIDQIFEKLSPCAIITPLDCFWEGSKLLGPDFPITIPGYGEKVRWTNLNPQRIVEKLKAIKESSTFFPFSSFDNFMKRAGITTAYQQKPCLNPLDDDCPVTAPNKRTLEPPDIGAELTGGCYGFAGKYLHWPEELIVGGTKTNRTRHIVRAEAYQSIVQLMGSKDLYEHYQNHHMVQYIDWSQQKAKVVLDAWVEKFAQRVWEVTAERLNETRNFSLQPFASSTLSALIRQFSNVSITRIVVGCVVMVIYSCISLLRVSRVTESGAGLGLAGVVLVIGSVASGLGLCALLGLPFNAATTQILPFLALGLGVDDLFIMVYTVAETRLENSNMKGYQESQVGDVLKRCGISVILTSVCNATAFFSAAIIPVPALRILCLQAGILVIATLAVILLVFPSLISLDLWRRRASKMDLLCCLSVSRTTKVSVAHSSIQDSRTHSAPSSVKSDIQKRTAVTRALSPHGRGTVTQVFCSPSNTQECWVGIGSLQAHSPSLESLTADSTRDLVPEQPQSWLMSLIDCGGWSIQRWVKEVYAPMLTQGSVKAISMFFLFLTIAAAAWGVSRLKDGLNLTDIVPRGTRESQFLESQQKYFGFYNMFAVTQGNFEYPTKQKLLHEYHEAFNRVPWIIKNDDGGLSDSWLSLFRDWLIGLQRAFDDDWQKTFITEEGWTVNASDSGVLAYKLLAQTGYVDHPVDRSLVSQVRLVDSEGIVNPKAFYNYLTAWMSNDALAYSASQSDLRPTPRIWYHDRSDFDLKIPKSSPLVYTQFPFYLNQLDDTEVITQMIQEVRSICKRFEDRGLPNFPTGVPFTFWEQYIKLRFFIVLALAAVLGSVFIILASVLVNIWAASLVVLILACLVLQLSGVLGILGIKLSAAPAVLLVVAVGIGVDFTVHVTLGFLTAIGDRNCRIRIALTHMMSPVMHGAFSTFLAILMLLFSEFDFIRRYFFFVIVALVVLGVLDGLLFLPVLLSLVGPPAELISKSNPDRVPTPSPPPSPPPPYPQSVAGPSRRHRPLYHPPQHQIHQQHHLPGLHGSNLSLTTITEEPASNGSSSTSTSSRQSSHEILVEPQVVVETTTYSAGSKPGGNKESDSVIYHEGGHVTTTVTATAKVKVELHKPVSGLSEGVHRTNINSSRGCGRRGTRCGSSPSNASVSSSGSRCSNSSGGSSCSRHSCSEHDSDDMRSSQ